MRFNLAFRLFAIVASFIVLVWISIIVSYHLTNDAAGGPFSAEPEQLAAMADMAAALPPEERSVLLSAVNTRLLSAEFLPRSEIVIPSGFDGHLDETLVSSYQAALGPRLVAIARDVAAHRNDEWYLQRPRLFPPSTPVMVFYIALGDATMFVVRSQPPVFLTNAGLPAGMLAGLIGAFFAAMALIVLHREVRPLRKLALAVEKIDLSGAIVALPEFRATTPEIRTLLEAFDRLQVRLNSLTRSRMALIGGIQHDVRTFATRLRLRLDALPDENERERAVGDIEDMIALLDDALLTSRASVDALDAELLDLDEWLPAQIWDFRDAGRPVSFIGHARSQKALVLADRLALRRILHNLVDNAVKYGHAARVVLNVRKDTAEIVIDDDGPGFADADIQLLLEPFVRAEPSRARLTGGAGLGLAVSRTLSEAQGATIVLSNQPAGGRATLSMPIFTFQTD